MSGTVSLPPAQQQHEADRVSDAEQERVCGIVERAGESGEKGLGADELV